MASEPGRGPQRGFWPDWLTPRRWRDFGANMLRIEASVSRLEEENAPLRKDIARLEREVERHGAQIEILVTFAKRP